ncbi:hypothetical protein SAMN05444405_104164 [Bacteroides luti]|jgi:hypothetical protein|uniref:Uncharacterized protein n=1 Tax=Bacteroides luti TaxID=1297750 RepID=A0A1M4XXZ0_9BACE|nr:hypothetical protein [Bacteroides luti]SHE98474.1 hypothetical protein SAMN05444405_104164 [Bacteroides luti]
MKKWFWVLLLLPVMNIHAQIKQAVNWQYHVNKVANDEYEAVLSAKIEKAGIYIPKIFQRIAVFQHQ